MSNIFEKGKRSILSLVQKLGEMCITTHWDNSHRAKLANHDIVKLWVGFAEGLWVSTYLVYNPKTKRMNLTKYVTLLNMHMVSGAKLKNLY